MAVTVEREGEREVSPTASATELVMRREVRGQLKAKGSCYRHIDSARERQEEQRQSTRDRQCSRKLQVAPLDETTVDGHCQHTHGHNKTIITERPKRGREGERERE